MVNPWHKYKKASKRKKQALHSLIAGLVLFCLLYIVTRFVSVPLCLVKNILGVDCPGCGMMRGFISILRLDFPSAIHYNILSIPVFVGVLLYSVLCFSDILFDKNHLEQTERFLKKPFVNNLNTYRNSISKVKKRGRFSTQMHFHPVFVLK